MARFATKREKGFIWLPREAIPGSDLKINGTTQYTQIWNASFTRVLCPEIGSFSILLDNNNEEFTDVYSKDQEVEFFTDLTDGTTSRFKGIIDTIKNRQTGGQGFTLRIEGGHITSDDLLLTNVTASFASGTGFETIIDSIIDEFLDGRGYTSNVNSTASSTDKPVNWNNKPFWDCIFDLTKLASASAYANDSKVIQFFDKGSIENNNEAIVWNDTLISTNGIGTQNLTNRDKIQAIGDDGEGLPVISTKGTGIKEKIIFDTKLTTFDQASASAQAELDFLDTDITEGDAEAFILPSLSPGDKIWVTNPPMGLREQVTIYKYTHKFPLERTSVFVDTARNIPLVFKKRIENELALQTIINPFKMLESLNLKFDSEDELVTKDTNVSLSEGKIKLSSGVSGVFLAAKAYSFIAKSVHLLVVGTELIGTKYEVRKLGETKFQTISPDIEITLDGNQQGTNMEIRVTLNSATTEILSLTLLAKS